MIDCVNAFYEGMVQRSEEMKRHPNYKTGENYAYLGLPPCFLIFDEYVAFFEMLGTKESVSLLSQLKKIVMLGRQAGWQSQIGIVFARLIVRVSLHFLTSLYHALIKGIDAINHFFFMI